jgi:hypothetical protein
MRKLTHEEQIVAIAKINPDVEVLGRVVDSKTPVLCRCKVCGHEWFVRPFNLKSGKGCPECAKPKMVRGRKLSHEEHVAAVTKVNPYVEILGKITNNATPVLCRCRICDHKWSPTPHSLKSKQGCPVCGRLKTIQSLKLSHDRHIEAILKVNPNVEILGEVTGNTTKVWCRCKTCKHKWMATPHNLKSGKGCPKCAKYGFRNHLESCLYLLVDNAEIPTCIKIGVTNDFGRRLKEIEHRTPFPIYALKVFTFEAGCATLQLEQLAHTVFADRNCRFEGFDGCTEWFWYSHEILEFIENNC